MSLRHLVPTLALIAAGSAALNAVEIRSANNDVSLRIGLRLQSQVVAASATAVDNAGDDIGDMDIFEGQVYPDGSDDDPQSVNIMFRRVRLSFAGTYKDDTFFTVIFDADNTGRGRSRDINFNTTYLKLGHRFHSSDELTHSLWIGQDFARFQPSAFQPTASLLFPNVRPIGFVGFNIPGVNLGLHYDVKTPLVHLFAGAVKLDGNEDASDPTTNSNNNDWAFYLRAEGAHDPDALLGRYAESFLGAEGAGYRAGLGVAIKQDGSDNDDGAWAIVADCLIHYNQLTANLDFAYGVYDNAGDGGDDRKAMGFSAQAGWAIPLDNGLVVEPALRFSWIDLDTTLSDYGNAAIGGRGYTYEHGGSGTYFDLGFNTYFAGHSHKLQAALQFWSAAKGDADAVVFRLQHQLNF